MEPMMYTNQASWHSTTVMFPTRAADGDVRDSINSSLYLKRKQAAISSTTSYSKQMVHIMRRITPYLRHIGRLSWREKTKQALAKQTANVPLQ